MSKRRHARPSSPPFSAVSRTRPPEETAAQKTPLINGENGKNGNALLPKDERGRFTKGNPGGPGRPRKRSQGDFQQATLGVIPLDGWERVVAKALEDAQDGDKHARRWLSDYVVGHPTTPHMVDGVPASQLERVIGLLRDTGHEPEQVFDNLILRLEQAREAQLHERRSHSG